MIREINTYRKRRKLLSHEPLKNYLDEMQTANLVNSPEVFDPGPTEDPMK